MDELQQGLDFCLHGGEAEKHLSRFREQIKKWDVAMPPVIPLVSDFGLGKFLDIGLIEYWIANEKAAGYCGKYLFVFDRQTCPMHRHRDKLETFLIVKGRVRMDYDGVQREMAPGEVLLIERWKYHSFTGLGPALLLEISMPCVVADNYFADTTIPLGGNYWKEN